MSYSINCTEKRNVLLSHLPGVSKFKGATVDVNHSHNKGDLIGLDQNQIIAKVADILDDIKLYHNALASIQKLYEDGAINKKTKIQLIRIFEVELKADERLLDCAKLIFSNVKY